MKLKFLRRRSVVCKRQSHNWILFLVCFLYALMKSVPFSQSSVSSGFLNLFVFFIHWSKGTLSHPCNWWRHRHSFMTPLVSPLPVPCLQCPWACVCILSGRMMGLSSELDSFQEVLLNSEEFWWILNFSIYLLNGNCKKVSWRMVKSWWWSFRNSCRRKITDDWSEENGSCRKWFGCWWKSFQGNWRTLETCCQKIFKEIHKDDLWVFNELVLFSRLFQDPKNPKRIIGNYKSYKWKEIIKPIYEYWKSVNEEKNSGFGRRAAALEKFVEFDLYEESLDRMSESKDLTQDSRSPSVPPCPFEASAFPPHSSKHVSPLPQRPRARQCPWARVYISG